MPDYDYRCQSCRQAFTLERSMSDSTKATCLHCGSTDTSRIWNVFILSGGTTVDVGQGASRSSTKKKSGCGSCSSHSCGTCH